jgi:single-strand DNA-binding protein
MGEYNKVILLGNLTRDPDLRYTPTGMPVCEFPIAVHHRHRLNDEVKEEVCYIDIVAFGKIGEHSKKFSAQGGAATGRRSLESAALGKCRGKT